MWRCRILEDCVVMIKDLANTGILYSLRHFLLLLFPLMRLQIEKGINLFLFSLGIIEFENAVADGLAIERSSN